MMNLWPKRKSPQQEYANVTDYRLEIMARRLANLSNALLEISKIEWSYGAARIAREALQRDKVFGE